MKKNRQVFGKGRYHTREQYERQQSVLRCKVCAEHTDIRCSGCCKPICMRHKWSLDTVRMFCWDCFHVTIRANRVKSTISNGRSRVIPSDKALL